MPELPVLGRLTEGRYATESDASELCPWCDGPIELGTWVVAHSVATPDGWAFVGLLHGICSEDQIEHEENFGDR